MWKRVLVWFKHPSLLLLVLFCLTFHVSWIAYLLFISLFLSISNTWHLFNPNNKFTFGYFPAIQLFVCFGEEEGDWWTQRREYWMQNFTQTVELRIELGSVILELWDDKSTCCSTVCLIISNNQHGLFLCV